MEQARIKAVYSIVEHTSEDQHWIRVGTAFVNRDNSINVLLDCLPYDRKLHIRDPRPRDPKARD